MLDNNVEAVEDVVEEVETMDDIDTNLLNEFGIDVEEETEVEEKEAEVEEAPEEVAEEGQEDVHEEPQFSNENQNQAFAQMRVEAKQAREEAQRYQEAIDALMGATGYDDRDAFLQEVLKAQEQQIMQEQGHTEETYQMQKQLEQRAYELQQQEQFIQQQQFMAQATEFNKMVEENAAKYGLTAGEIYNRLEESGLSDPEAVIYSPNPELLLKGVMVEEIYKAKIKEAEERNASRPEVNSDPLYRNNAKVEGNKSELDNLLSLSLDDDLL